MRSARRSAASGRTSTTGSRAALVALGLERAGVLERGDRAVLARTTAAWRQASSPVSSATARTSRSVTRDLDAAADQPRVERVVAGVEAQVAGPAAPAAPSADRCPARVAGSGAITARSSSSRSIGRQRSVLCIRGLARSSNQASSCSWKSSSLAKRRPGSKLRSMKSCRRSTHALGLRVARLAEVPADPQRAAERGELRGRAAAAGVQPGLAIPDQRLRQRAQRPQTARGSRTADPAICLEKTSAPAPARE